MVIGLMAVHTFPLAPLMLHNLSLYCDKVILRFDTFNGNKKILKRCSELVPRTKLQIILSKQKWNRFNWRQELVDEASKYKPELILFPDSDECFHPNVVFDIQRFLVDKKVNIMMFGTDMITDDGRKVKTYPEAKHCKMFKWQEGINYMPYKTHAVPNIKHSKKMKAQTPILHWCFYTPLLEKTKQFHR